MAINTDVAEAGEKVRANRYDVLSRLADDLAHEIKSPLNAIVVNLEVLKRRVETGSPDAALERAAVIEQEIRRVHGLVDQMLQLMRPAKADSSPLAVDGIIDALANAIQIQAKSARVGLEVETESSLFAQIRSEPFKFALLNLMMRAIDAEAAAGGRVRIEAKRHAHEIHVVVSCSKALADEAEERLNFCRLLVESAGGALAALEPHNDGPGSRVTVVLPLARFK
ncbi:MAG: sensor histidine kinase [Gemmatimonadota bacterium]